MKHFFIGDKRIASKIGNPPGNDPRGITGVAGKTLHIKVDYPVKYSEQKEQVSANYTNFAMPYSNIDMNHYDYPFNRPGYWNGCVPPNENGTVIVRSANARNGEDANDEEDVSSLRNSPRESSLFFYHTDHLGSTNIVTGHGRSICHATEYLPYGEVFLEIKGSYDHLGTPFKFNGKEMDPETGMLYYGARYYMPKYCQWPTCDPMQLKYPGVSSYAYCMGNPVNRIDPEGKDGVLVFDHENNVIVVKANYYVQTVGRPSIYGNNLGYTPSDIKYLNNQINGYLNNLNLKVEDGVYCNYSIKFELSFISGGNQIDVANKASEDFYEGVHIGNTFSKWDTTFKLFIPSSENGVDNVVGGVTNHKNEIIMNYLYDGKMNRVHEVFHTLGFDDFSHGEKNHGIMSYPPRKPDQSDVNRLVYGGFLPMLHK